MKTIFQFTILLLFIPFSISAQDQTNNLAVQQNELVGEWTIDLRPTPDAKGYLQTFSIKSIDGKTFKGTFYGSEISKAFLNTNWDKLYFAFRSKDKNYAYYHSGYMQDGKLYGISYCPGRNFTAPWTGTKK